MYRSGGTDRRLAGASLGRQGSGWGLDSTPATQRVLELNMRVRLKWQSCSESNMAKYAARTDVSVKRSREQIESLLEKYDADAFAFGRDMALGKAVLSFRHNKVCYRYVIEIIDNPQEERCRWRALYIVIKGMLVAVDSKIMSFETAFMPWILGANGKSLGETLAPQLEQFRAEGKVQLMALPAPE